MYHTPSGDRILIEAERRLFVESLAMVVDLLAIDDIELGVASFDELQRPQKLLVLYNAARGLLRPNAPPPKLTAFVDAAVATVYEFAKDQVKQEIENPEFCEGTTHWRRMILGAARQQNVSGELLDDTSDELESWVELVECLAGCVLWDNDYEWQGSLDAPPEESRRVRDILGVAGDYYTDVPPDPPDDQVALYVDALMGLTADVR